jgi:preprotein translocase subunit SecE
MNYLEVINKVKGFYNDVKSEAKKVVWPGKQYITAATIVVLIIVFLVAFFIMFLDFSFSRFFALFPKPGMNR